MTKMVLDFVRILPWMPILSVLHMVSFLTVCAHCLRHRREVNSTLVWIFLAWSFPFVGALCYAAIGVDRVREKGFRKQATDLELQEARNAKAEEPSRFYWHGVRGAVESIPADPWASALNRTMNPLLPDHPLVGGNSVDPLVDGDEAFPAMRAAIERATHHVHLQSFIIHGDEAGASCMDLLARKAREGVRVRILYDRFGSTYALLKGFFRRYRSVPNMEVVGWTQANPLKRQVQINLRNHRKIMVVDGETAFLGGINLHDENVTRDGRSAIRDYHFRLSGPVVNELQYSFMKDWYFMTDSDPEELLQDVYFPVIAPRGGAMVRLVSGGPTESESGVISDVALMAIGSARRQVLLVTPYFVPPRYLVNALRMAALRGVDVHLILPLKNNHLCAGWASRAYYEELLEAGVIIVERRPPFMHAKALLVDSTFAMVGTANMDARSLRLNYETNAVVYDEDSVNRMKQIVLADAAQSDPVVLARWRRRPVFNRMRENLCDLMSPIL